MSKKAIISTVVALAVVAVGLFLYFKKNPTQQPNNQTVTTTEQSATNSQSKTVAVAMLPQNNSGESGIATLKDINGKTSVVLTLSGAPTGVTQPAHIHTGSCATIGGVAYPLTFPVNGSSETILNVSLDELLKKLPLAINVHKSGSEANVYFACGDITNSPTTSQNAPTVSQPAQTSNPSVNTNRTDGGTFSTPTDKRKGADKPEDN